MFGLLISSRAGIMGGMTGIKNKFKKLGKNLANIFPQELSPLFLMLNFLGIIGLRTFEDKFLASSSSPWEDVMIELMHNFLFFSLTSLLVWLILSFFLKKKPRELISLVAWSNLLVLLPPLFDMVKTKGNVFWSFYLLSDIKTLFWQFLTIFGNLPTGIVYFGTKITFLVAIFLIMLVIYTKTRKIIKALSAGLVVYIALFLMGSFPSWFVFLAHMFQGKSPWEVNAITIVQFFGSPVEILGFGTATLKYAFAYQIGMIFYMLLIFLAAAIFYLNNKEKFWAIIKNARFPQLIYHLGLLIVGMGLGFWMYPQNWHSNLFSILAISIVAINIVLAWLASVVFNDIYDYKIDIISNSYRPLQKKIFTMEEYWQLGIILFILSLIGSMTVSVFGFILLLAYQIVAWFYSAPPYRLKRFPLIATFFSAIASLLILFLGFIMFSGEEKLAIFPWRIGFMFLFGLTLSLPMKDFRDIEGDRKDGVLTWPIILGYDLGAKAVGSGIFISFVMSVFFLNELKLFWWAVLFGGISFWIVNNPAWKGRMKKGELVGWILSAAMIYALVMAKILFADMIK
ncbi:MAG TPA: hypothetical protein DIC35_03375 [Candidatus Moranbacteria bacterium]|nr:hypothetical protein [Candidatus Moranbacteria bacterium]